jgi:hypothetical protein
MAEKDLLLFFYDLVEVKSTVLFDRVCVNQDACDCRGNDATDDLLSLLAEALCIQDQV